MYPLSSAIWGITTLQVEGSAVSGPYSAVSYCGEATVDGDEPDAVENWGAPGIVFRPRPPKDTKGEDGQWREIGCEAQAATLGERVIPIAWRDIRFNKVFPAPKPGTVALVGYGGGFISFDDVNPAAPDSPSRLTQYVPYDFDENDVPRKCHSIILDPEQETLAIIQGDGRALVLSPDGMVARVDGSTWLDMGPGRFNVVASSICLQGNVVLGGNAVGAVPLTPTASSPSVFVSQAGV